MLICVHRRSSAANILYGSEDQLQAQLQLPRTAQVAARGARGEDLSECRRGQVIGRLAEIRMIEEVEGLRAELERGPFLDGGGFGDREIDVFESRRRENVAAGIAEAGRLRYECRWVQIARGGGIRQIQRHTGHDRRTIESLQTSLAVGDLNNLADRPPRL